MGKIGIFFAKDKGLWKLSPRIWKHSTHIWKHSTRTWKHSTRRRVEKKKTPADAETFFLSLSVSFAAFRRQCFN